LCYFLPICHHDCILKIEQEGHLWCTRSVKITLQFQHTPMHPEQYAWDDDWAKFEPAWTILADSTATVARRTKTQKCWRGASLMHPQAINKHLISTQAIVSCTMRVGGRPISRVGGTAGWLWNLRPGNAERPKPRFPAQPDRTSTTGPQAPQAHRLTATPKHPQDIQVGHHLPRGRGHLGSRDSKWATTGRPAGGTSGSPGIAATNKRPIRTQLQLPQTRTRIALARKTLAGLGSDPPPQDRARTQLQGPRDPGNRLILPQVKPKPQDNAAPRPPRHQRGT
jgi:hypothetical protein